MGMANIDALLAEIASLKESLRIKNQSLANLGPYQANQAYITRLKGEIAAQNASLATAQARLASDTATTPKVAPTRANTETNIQSTPYDDEGNLNPGWYINEETGQPYFVGTPPKISTPPDVTAEEDPFEASRLAAEQQNADISPTEQTVIDAGEDPQLSQEEQAVLESYQADQRAALAAEETAGGITTQGLTNLARTKATQDDATSFQHKPDWRVKLSLAPGANYLYKVGDGQAGILNPLQNTDGVIFPYTPAISVSYVAGYDSTDIIHSNFKVFQYKGSSVDSFQITGDFTAQDTTEANYLLAVIHFFRSVTKMFYGQDENPKNGVPPPLLYLTGLGTYQFDAHPLAVTNFTYSLPTDVDYIRASSQTNQPGQNLSRQQTPVNSDSLTKLRTVYNGLTKTQPTWTNQNSLINSEATYVPTKMQIQLTAVPIVTRNDISNNFSLAKYGTGELLRGTKRSGGGIW